jgi:hypothetical protein
MDLAAQLKRRGQTCTLEAWRKPKGFRGPKEKQLAACQHVTGGQFLFEVAS